MIESKKTFGAIAGSALLASAGVLAVAPMVVDTNDTVALAAENATQTEAEAVAVEGTFSFTQNAVTSNAAIAGVFNKAAAAVCANMPEYGVEVAKTIVVSYCNICGTEITVSSDDEGSIIMGCACSSNAAGGGAVLNAEVSGMTLASILAMAGAQA